MVYRYWRSLVIVCYAIVSRKTNEMSDSRPIQPSSELEHRSIEQARALIDDLIARGEKLFVEPADVSVILPEKLGPTTREFFARYGTLRTRLGGFRLAAADIRPSEHLRGYLSIGHSEDWDLVQQPSSDQVFVVEGYETRESELEVRFPSVYHLVLDEAQRT